MNANERLLVALNKAIEIKPDVEIGKFLRYITSCSDLAYMTDDDIAVLVENYNHMSKEFSSHWNYTFDSTDINFLDEAYNSKSDFKWQFDFSKENEQIAYERYKKRIDGKIFFNFEERLSLRDFLTRFNLMYVDAKGYSGITVINHRDSFLNDFPVEYRHMNAYVIGRRGSKYIAMHKYAVKNPCFGELLDSITFGMSEGFDEVFSIAIDWNESPRFTDYTEHIMYGVSYRPVKNEMEIYTDNQTIEIFHELMQKANKITTDWDFNGNGVLYTDGTV